MATSQDELTTLITDNGGGVLPLLVSTIITLLFAFIAAMPAARYAAKVSPIIAMSGTAVNVKRRNRKTGSINETRSYSC